MKKNNPLGTKAFSENSDSKKPIGPNSGMGNHVNTSLLYYTIHVPCCITCLTIRGQDRAGSTQAAWMRGSGAAGARRSGGLQYCLGKA
jgi:hypothetical protein